MRITRRHLQISLAVLWLFDGVLQCQPIMFSHYFVRGVLAPASHGQSAILAAPIHVIAALASGQPALVNGGAVLIQIVLGLALLARRCTRVALSASIAWALSVWIVGEGLGGITTGSTLLTGAPGAALLYALIAVLAWPSRDPTTDDRPSRLALPAWCTLWLTGALLQLLNGNNSATSITMMLRAAQSGSPSWIVGIDRSLVRMHFPTWAPAAMIAIDVLVAIWALVPGWTRHLSLAIGSVTTLGGWLFFQGLGDLTSGRATDPNTGPLVILLALSVASVCRSGEATALENWPRQKNLEVWDARSPLTGAQLSVRCHEKVRV